MWLLDDWHDYIRVFSLIMALICLVLLGLGSGKMQKEYNSKARDLWFAVVLWCITSVALAVEGMYEDRPMEPRLIFYTLATVLTFKVLTSKAPWGTEEQVKRAYDR